MSVHLLEIRTEVTLILFVCFSVHSVEFVPGTNSTGGTSSTSTEGPFAAIGGSDGAVRILSLQSLSQVQRLAGGHRGAVHALRTFTAPNGEVRYMWYRLYFFFTLVFA